MIQADHIPTLALAALATATAEYESAWRESCGIPVAVFDAERGCHVENPARREVTRRMAQATEAQRTARDGIAGIVGEPFANAVVGALIQTAARTHGVREPGFPVSEPYGFIKDCIAGEAGV